MKLPQFPAPAVRHVSKRSQRGVAAVEFAIVSLVFVLCLYVIATLGVMLHTKQVLSRSAASGAITISSSSRSYKLSEVENAVFSSLSQSLLVPLGIDAAVQPAQIDAPLAVHPTPQQWVAENVTVHLTPHGSSANEMVLEVRYPYAQNAILPAFPGLGFLIPAQLSGWATVAIGP